MSNFRIGQKVVCVDDVWLVAPSPLANGAVYTIAAKATAEVRGESVLWLDLLEVKNPTDTWEPHLPPGFNAARFRPAVDRPTSIAIFQKMLLNDKDRNKRELARLNEERGAPMELPFQ